MVAIHSPDASLANPTRRSRGCACGDILIDVMHDTPGPLLFLSHWPRASEISGMLLRSQTSGEASCAFRKAARASSSVGASMIGACAMPPLATARRIMTPGQESTRGGGGTRTKPASSRFRTGAKLPLLEGRGQSNHRRAVQALKSDRAKPDSGRRHVGFTTIGRIWLVENFKAFPAAYRS